MQTATLLRSAAESVLHETIAGMTFAELLTSHRQRFHEGHRSLASISRRTIGGSQFLEKIGIGF